MKRIVLGTVVAVAWCVAAPLAQQQPANGPKTEPAHNVFVLTGCIAAGPAAKPAAAFTVTDASFIGQRPAVTSAEAGTAGTSGQKASYELRPVTGVGGQGLDADELKAHLGQRVEMLVRPVDTPAAPRAAKPAEVQPATPIEPSAEQFTVTEIRRVIGSCQ
jgi:hypothetical protein